MPFSLYLQRWIGKKSYEIGIQLKSFIILVAGLGNHFLSDLFFLEQKAIMCMKTIRAYWSQRRVVINQFFSELITTQKRISAWCHRKQSLLILFTMQSYKSYDMVSPQTVFTYPFHHAKLQILLHCVTANSLYLSLSPCKATNLTTWCHHKQSLLILFTMQSYKSYFVCTVQYCYTEHVTWLPFDGIAARNHHNE